MCVCTYACMCKLCNRTFQVFHSFFVNPVVTFHSASFERALYYFPLSDASFLLLCFSHCDVRVLLTVVAASRVLKSG